MAVARRLGSRTIRTGWPDLRHVVLRGDRPAGLTETTLLVANSDPAQWVEEVQLLGVPTLADYVHRAQLANGATAKNVAIDEWRRAAEHYALLETTEAGVADSPSILDLPEELLPARDRLIADPHFERTFSESPIAFGMVELDRLVAYQHHLSRDHAAKLNNMLGAMPSAEAVFGLCLPIRHTAPEVQVSVSGRKFVFQSAADDFRVHSPKLLEAAVLQTLVGSGPVVAGVGLTVGFGSSYLNVVRWADRLVLNNGYHRAYALRSMGITHVPCVIQAMLHADELAFAGESALIDDYANWFSAPRPPLFKDFFDPLLSTVLRRQRTRQQIQISFTVETVRVPI